MLLESDPTITSHDPYLLIFAIIVDNIFVNVAEDYNRISLRGMSKD